MNWTDPVDLSGVVLVVIAALIGFVLPLILKRGREANEADRVTLICKVISMVLALVGIILLILI